MAGYALWPLPRTRHIALHELDPAFRKVTLENERLRALVRDLKFHKDPVGMLAFDTESLRCSALFTLFFLALQSMVITKQTQIGGEGMHSTIISDFGTR